MINGKTPPGSTGGGGPPLSPSELILQKNTMEYRMNRKSCLNDMEFGRYFERVSLIFAIIALSVYLSSSKKARYFPHNIPAIMLLAVIIRNTGLWLGYVLAGDPQRDNQFYCTALPILKSSGFHLLFYSWMVMLYVFYKVTVKNVLMCKIRLQRKFFYAIMLGIPLILVLIPSFLGLYEYTPVSKQCVITASASASYLLLYFHPTIGVLVFLFYGIPVIKTLFRSDANFLARSRLLMLREVAVRQTALGVIVLIVAVITSYVGIERLLVAEWDSAENSIVLRKLAYSSCAMFRIFQGFFGLVISLVFLCTRENYHRIKKYFPKSTFGGNAGGSSSDDTITPYQAANTPSVNKSDDVEIARQKAQFPSGFDNHARSGYSIAYEGENATLRTQQLLQWAREKLEVDGIRLNEHELKEFVSEVDNDDGDTTPGTTGNNSEDRAAINIQDDSQEEENQTFVVNDKVELRYERNKQHWIEALQQEADALEADNDDLSY